MSYRQDYISGGVDDKSSIISLHREISDLGFDPLKESPKEYSVIRTVEGFDIYYELFQHLQLVGEFENNTAMFSFTFRSIRDEEDSDFKLNDITAKLLILENGETRHLATTSYGKNSGIPTKDQMIQSTVDRAAILSRAQQVSAQIEKTSHPMKNKL